MTNYNERLWRQEKEKMMESIEQQVEAIANRLPIEFPEQVYVRKGDEYIQSYDPVLSIEIIEDVLNIEGSPYTYTHSLDEFDRVYIAVDEPVVLENQ